MWKFSKKFKIMIKLIKLKANFILINEGFIYQSAMSIISDEKRIK